MRPAALRLRLTAFSALDIRVGDDVPDQNCRVDTAHFPALADFPGEAQCVLIAPCWMVTAAHAVTWPHALRSIAVRDVSAGTHGFAGGARD